MVKKKHSAMLKLYKFFILATTIAIFLLFPTILSAQVIPEQVIPTVIKAQIVPLENQLNNLWVLVAGIIAVNTTLSACSSGCTVIVYRRIRESKIDLSTVLNGLLGGLVGITASCDVVSPFESLIIGVFTGLVVIWGINLLNKQKIDDAVGAIPVHCFCGIWGGVATGFFSSEYNFVKQIVGSFFIPAWSFVMIWLCFYFINSIFVIRVKEDEEKDGLDYEEHNEFAYVSLEKKEKL